MDATGIPDPRFREAVRAIDAGDLPRLERLLADHPDLACERLETGEGYFSRPYLLWFVAENPVRQGRLPHNIVEVAAAVLGAARRAGCAARQIDYALGLVGSGRVPRECGVQLALIDLLVEAGARPAPALPAALAHGELAAAARLLERGAPLTLAAAACFDRLDDVRRLAGEGDDADRRAAMVGAAMLGRAAVLEALLEAGADPNAYGPPGFHPHATPLHQAVYAGSLSAVETLLGGGADPSIRDRIYQGTALDWAEHLKQAEIADYLRRRGAPA